MSWQGRRNKVTVRCRLYRALANEDWHALFHVLIQNKVLILRIKYQDDVENFGSLKDGLDKIFFWNQLREVG